MFRLCLGDVSDALAKASEYTDAIWRLWRYSESSQVLALCGYRAPFDKVGYLLFRKPRAVRLPRMATGVRFGVDPGPWEGTDRSAPPPADSATVHRVSMHSEGRTYEVICEDVSFYEAVSPPEDCADVRQPHHR